MKIMCKCNVTLEGLDLFWEIQAALFSIHRIFLLLWLIQESWPKGTRKSFLKLLCCKCRRIIE